MEWWLALLQSPIARCLGLSVPPSAQPALEAPISTGSMALLQSAEWQTAGHPLLSALYSTARPARQPRPSPRPAPAAARNPRPSDQRPTARSPPLRQPAVSANVSGNFGRERRRKTREDRRRKTERVWEKLDLLMGLVGPASKEGRGIAL